LDRIAASRRSTKCTPLTTRPSFTSRQGMTRHLSMVRSERRGVHAGAFARLIRASASAGSSRPSYNARPRSRLRTSGSPASTSAPHQRARRGARAITGMLQLARERKVASMLRPLRRPSRAIVGIDDRATPASSNRLPSSAAGSSALLAQPSTATLPSRASIPTAMRPG